MRRLTFPGTGDPLNAERARTSLTLTLADRDLAVVGW